MRASIKRFACALPILFLVWSATALGDVQLPAIIGDNMALQRGKPLPVWGTAAAGEEVTVKLGDQAEATTADDEGNWSVTLQPVDETGPIEMSVAGNNTIALENVIVSEVWVCSGQSNMEWSVTRAADAEAEIAAADYPKIRLFQAKKVVAGEPQSDTEGSWVECSPDTVPGFSAVGYFFGREVHKSTGLPVGLIQTAWGGTPAEAWTSRGMLESHDELQPILDRWDAIVANSDDIRRKHADQIAEWREKVKQAKAEGRKAPARPRPPAGPGHPHRASGLYNGMITPLAPFAIRGAIWYQGESNASRAYQYRTLFPAMIQDWRNTWQQGDFPFLFVQLANFRKRAEQPGDSDWAELREAQSKTLSLPNTGMAVIIDIGEADDIHPRNKQDVGARLALAAGALAYGSDQVYSGPIFRSMKKEGDKIRLEFDHAGGGLVGKQGEKLESFAIAGEDRKFVWADARIEGDSVMVSSDEVDVPVAVRYAWADNPVASLYNEEGLPASPFRTDDWPGVTQGRN